MTQPPIKPLRVLVVAQTPSPIHGQSVMTEYFLSGSYQQVELHHIESREIGEVGKAGLSKVFHLFALIGKILAARFRLKPDVLYFPPAGPNMVPFLRDCVILSITRPFFPKTVFHFHAAGLPGLYDRLSGPLKWLFRRAYFHPDVAISISRDGLRDAEFIQAKKTALVPNGIPDLWADRYPRDRVDVPTILFLAMVSEEKGVGVLIEACKQLTTRGHTFRCKIAGKAASETELRTLKDQAAELGDRIEFVGPVTGDQKWDLFAYSEIFCFPTYYSSESFGLVVVEAMMTGMPVVASNWRALPEIVADGKSGFLVPVQDPKATADRLAKLLRDPILRQVMGSSARNRYLEHFHVDTFRQRMEEALLLASEERKS